MLVPLIFCSRYLVSILGGMFEFVSAANFLGEIIEWCGFALAAGSLAAFAFAFYSASNLIPRGFSHHRYTLLMSY